VCPCALLDLDDGARVEPDDEHADEEAEHPEDSRARAVDLVSFSCAQTPLSIAAHSLGCVIRFSDALQLNSLEEAYVIMSKKRQDIQRLLDEKQRIADHTAATGEWKASRVHQHARDALIARPQKEYEGKPADAEAIRLDLIRLGVAGRDHILTT
jgi:hypothetical protein